MTHLTDITYQGKSYATLVLHTPGFAWDLQAYPVLEHLYEGFVKNIEKLQRKAEKLGVPAPVLRTIGQGEVRRVSYPDDGGRPRRWLQPVKLVQVSGHRPMLDGWRFVATLDGGNVKADDGTSEWVNLLTVAPDWEESLPASYRTAAPDCDHCGWQRRRKSTYVLHHAADGFKQVGSTCIKDFLGGAGPAIFAWAATFQREILGGYDPEWEPGFGGRAPESFSSLGYLSEVAASIREDGWLSNGKAWEQHRPEASTSRVSWHWHMNRATGAGKPPPYSITERDEEAAALALDWARNIDPETDSDYLHNLRIIALMNRVTVKYSGILASCISAFRRDGAKRLARERWAKLAESSRHFAKPGDRVGGKLSKTQRAKGATLHDQQPVQILAKRDVASDYGGSTLYTFAVTQGPYEGCVLKTFYSGSQDFGEVGAEGWVSGTVKRQSTYKGVAETMLNRVSFTG